MVGTVSHSKPRKQYEIAAWALALMPLFLIWAKTVSHASNVASAEASGATHLFRDVTQRPDDRLLAYAWDELAEIPSTYNTAESPIDYAELPPPPGTLLYLNFNEGTGSEILDLSPARRRIPVEGATWVRGRFGWAFAPSPGVTGQITIPGEAPFFGDLWTLEFWVRPDEFNGTRQSLVSEPDSVELAILGTGRLGLTLSVGGEQIKLESRTALRVGEWNHVAVVCDSRQFRHLRLIVNGKAQMRPLPEASVDRGRGEIILGDWRRAGKSFSGAMDQLSLVAAMTPTADLIARFEEGVEPGEHTLRLRFASGTRREKLWALPVRQPILRTPDDWARGALQYSVADNEGLRQVAGRWQRVRPPVSPTPRTTHPTLYVGDHKVFLFGGEVRDSHFPPMFNTNDTWLYDIEARRWELDESETAPPPRCHQDFAYSPDHDLVLLVGGWRNDSKNHKEMLSDVWVYHVSERRWEERSPSDFQIPSMSDSGVVYHQGLRRFLVFRQNQIYEYDPESNHWSRRPEPAVVDAEGRQRRMAGRVSPIMGYDPETGLILRFGGAMLVDGEQVYTDTTALYDHAENQWTVLQLDLAPPPRVRAGFAYDTHRKRFVLFGGVRDQFSYRYDDLWAFDVQKRRWLELEASGTPSARGGYYGMAYDPELDEFVLAAGRSSHVLLLNETWHLQFDPEAVGHATYVFDREGFPEANQWFDETSRPPGSDVRLQFSGSNDAVIWGDPVDDPGALQVPSSRFVKVDVEFLVSATGPSPRLLSMGFRTDPESRDTVTGGIRVLPITPYDPGARH